MSNRIDAGTAEKIMDAINARIPLPTIDEIERTPLRHAEARLASVKSSHADSLKLVEANKRLAAAAERDAEFWRQDAELQAQEAALWRAEIDRLTSRHAEEHADGREDQAAEPLDAQTASRFRRLPRVGEGE
jgi:hypothetical protein